MIATFVTVDVKPECISAFVDATRYNHVNSRREPGNVRFDVLRDRNDPNKFILYEVYVDEAAAAAHKETHHYKVWRDAVAPMMATPRSSVHTTPIAFD